MIKLPRKNSNLLLQKSSTVQDLRNNSAADLNKKKQDDPYGLNLNLKECEEDSGGENSVYAVNR